MKKFTGVLLSVLLLVSAPLLQGCAVGILAAGVGYAVSSGRRASAKMVEAKAKYTKAYDDYSIEMEKINVERLKLGAEEKPIKTFDEWFKQQPVIASEIKLFKKYGIFTAEDLVAKAKDEEEAKAEKEEEITEEEPTTNFSTR